MFIGSSVNKSATIAGVAGAELDNKSGYAVKFNASGNIVLAGAGADDNALGILLLQTDDKVAIGDDVSIQVTAMGKAVAGGAIAAGAMVTTNASGQLITAVADDNVFGVALEATAEAGDIFKVQITKGGKL